MSKGIFITGTGTDIGKTFITALILKKLRDNNINAGYYKAALSGAEVINDELIAGDAKYVCDISKINMNPNDLVSYIYKIAVSPHLAAEIENNKIDIIKIKDDFNKIKEKFEFITVEGSGGIICPLRSDDEGTIMLEDVIKELNLDVLIVASAELGTINNTVLTCEYAKEKGINVKGIILNGYDKNNFLHLDNKKQIKRLTNIPIIAEVEKNAGFLNMKLKNIIDLYKEI